MVEAEEKVVDITKGGRRLLRAVERRTAAVREHETMLLPYMFLDNFCI